MSAARRRRAWAAGALVCAAGLLPACGRNEPDRAATRDERVPVRVHTAESRPVARTVTLSGRLRASESVVIHPKLPGRLLALHHDEGDRVEAGALLAELDATQYQLELARARAAVTQAEARFEEARRDLVRTRELFEREIASQSRLDSAEVAARIAKADLETAIANRNLAAQRLEDTRIRAPIAGILQARAYSVGDLVSAGFGRGGRDVEDEEGRGGGMSAGLFELLQTDPLEIEFHVAEQDVPYVRPSDTPIELHVDILPGEPFLGRIDYIAPSLHPVSHTQALRLRVPNPDGRLKPGMFARIETTREIAEGALVIRAESLVNLGGSYAAFVVDADGRAALRRLEVAFVTENEAAVAAGLNAGDRVVFEGQSNLRDGVAVRIVSPDASGARTALDSGSSADAAAAAEVAAAS